MLDAVVKLKFGIVVQIMYERSRCERIKRHYYEGGELHYLGLLLIAANFAKGFLQTGGS